MPALCQPSRRRAYRDRAPTIGPAEFREAAPPPGAPQDRRVPRRKAFLPTLARTLQMVRAFFRYPAQLPLRLSQAGAAPRPVAQVPGRCACLGLASSRAWFCVNSRRFPVEPAAGHSRPRLHHIVWFANAPAGR